MQQLHRLSLQSVCTVTADLQNTDAVCLPQMVATAWFDIKLDADCCLLLLLPVAAAVHS